MSDRPRGSPDDGGWAGCLATIIVAATATLFLAWMIWVTAVLVGQCPMGHDGMTAWPLMRACLSR